MSDFIDQPPEEEMSSPAGPTIPHSREAEEAVVGSVLINPESYYDVAQFLISNDFYIHRHKWIWEAFTKLHETRTPIDLLTLSEELDKTGKLAEIGGSAFITSLISQVPSSLNAESYGRIVEGHSIRRKMINSANKIASLAYQENLDVQEAYSLGKKSLDDSFPIHGEFKTIQTLVSNDYDRVDARANGKEEKIIPTGFVDLDKILGGGMRPEELFYVGGRPSMGKTAFKMDIALHAARLGKRVGIFSLEMSNEQITQRLISKFGVNLQNIRTGKMADAEWPIYTHAIEVLNSYKINVDDTPALNHNRFRAKAHSMYNQLGVDLLVVDYVQLMQAEGVRASENRNHELGVISRMLKIVARELKVPVLVGAQLSRELERRQNKRPMLSDLRDSGTLEQDADVVIFPYRDEVYNKDTDKAGIAEINVAKQRNGPLGTIELIYQSEFATFKNAAHTTTRLNHVEERQRVDIHGD